MEQHIPSNQELVDAQVNLTKIWYENWLYEDLFTIQWWVILLLLIVPWFVWWKLVDKKRLVVIALYGITLAHFITILDATGAEIGLWSYPYKVLPLFNRLLSVDFSALPVIYMVMYQHFQKWRKFIFAHIVLAGILAFVLEPIAVLWDITKYHNWQHIYSFPFYIAIPIIMKWLIDKLAARSGLL